MLFRVFLGKLEIMLTTKSSTDVLVVGLGYIGLPTAAVFAAGNLRVVGFDVNEYAVEKINCGEIHIQEPGLLELVKKVVEQGIFCDNYTRIR